jgi:hypothetical protein
MGLLAVQCSCDGLLVRFVYFWNVTPNHMLAVCRGEALLQYAHVGYAVVTVWLRGCRDNAAANPPHAVYRNQCYAVAHGVS